MRLGGQCLGHGLGVYFHRAVGVGFLVQEAALLEVFSQQVYEVVDVVVIETSLHFLWEIRLYELHDVEVVLCSKQQIVVHSG